MTARLSTIESADKFLTLATRASTRDFVDMGTVEWVQLSATLATMVRVIHEMQPVTSEFY